MTLTIDYKNQRHLIRWIFLIVLVLVMGMVVFFGIRWYETGQVPPIPLPLQTAYAGIDESAVGALQISQYTVPYTNPRYLNISKLSTGNVRIYPVGFDSHNFVAQPSNISDVSWYQKSATPGSNNVSMMSGYSKGSTHGGAFEKASELVIGDTISIERGDGKDFTYAITSLQTMSLADTVSDGIKLMTESDKPGSEALNIMTDAGVWVPKLGSFNQRLIIRSVLKL
jgi:hypothetical protein